MTEGTNSVIETWVTLEYVSLVYSGQYLNISVLFDPQIDFQTLFSFEKTMAEKHFFVLKNENFHNPPEQMIYS